MQKVQPGLYSPPDDCSDIGHEVATPHERSGAAACGGHVARKRRLLEADVVYHVFNRRTDKQCLFASALAYDDFIGLLAEGRERYCVKLHAYCLMKTHWHLAISSDEIDSIPSYLRWLATTHAVRFRTATGTRGNGHVYQDRYKSVPTDGLLHYVTLVRYIEANAANAGLVGRAENWRWTSLRERLSGRNRIIEPGPWPLPSNWAEIVNAPDLSLAFEPTLFGVLAASFARRSEPCRVDGDGGRPRAPVGDGGRVSRAGGDGGRVSPAVECSRRSRVAEKLLI